MQPVICPHRVSKASRLEMDMADHQHRDHEAGHSCCTSEPKPKGGVIDPVCGMTVDPEATAHHATHAGADYHFCSAGCRMKFQADPEKYLSKNRAEQRPTPAGTIYTCPMHPEIRQAGPGSC